MSPLWGIHFRISIISRLMRCDRTIYMNKVFLNEEDSVAVNTSSSQNIVKSREPIHSYN